MITLTAFQFAAAAACLVSAAFNAYEALCASRVDRNALAIRHTLLACAFLAGAALNVALAVTP